MADEAPGDKKRFQRLKLYFLTGLVALAPVAITAYILWSLFFTIDNWLGGIYGMIPWLTINGRPVPGIGFLSVILIVLLTGVIARNILGGQLLRAVESQFTKIPMVRGIYGAVKQISQAFFSGNRAVFRRVVMVPFPTRGMWAIGFLTADAAPEVQRKTAEEMVSVFLPTTPNPTSGYLLMVRRDEAVELSMSVEEAMKLVISAGAVVPEDRVGEFLKRQASVAQPPPAVQGSPEPAAPTTKA